MPSAEEPASGRLLSGPEEPELGLCDRLGGGQKGGEEGGRLQGAVHTPGWFLLMYGRNRHNTAIILQLKMKLEILKKHDSH